MAKAISAPRKNTPAMRARFHSHSVVSFANSLLRFASTSTEGPDRTVSLDGALTPVDPRLVCALGHTTPLPSELAYLRDGEGVARRESELQEQRRRLRLRRSRRTDGPQAFGYRQVE